MIPPHPKRVATLPCEIASFRISELPWLPRNLHLCAYAIVYSDYKPKFILRRIYTIFVSNGVFQLYHH